MQDNPSRKLTVLDALILIVAIALAFMAMRSDYLWPDFSWKPIACTDYLTRANDLVQFIAPVFASLSVAILLHRLRRPRPSLRRLSRQPGFIAGLTTVIVLVIRTANLFAVAGVQILNMPKGMFLGCLRYVPMAGEIKFVPSEIGCAVAAVWAIQWLGGRWRPEAGWVDRAGRFMGTMWIATIPLSWFNFLSRI